MNNSDAKVSTKQSIGSCRVFEKPLRQSLQSLRAVIRHYIENTRIVYGNPYLDGDSPTIRFQQYVNNATASALKSIIMNLCDDKVLDVDIENNLITINSDRIGYMEPDILDLIPMAFTEVKSGYWFDVKDSNGDLLCILVYGNKKHGPEDIEFYGLESMMFIPEGSELTEAEKEVIKKAIVDNGGDVV